MEVDPNPRRLAELFFFLMIRRPLRSPLFPSTTLFRSAVAVEIARRGDRGAAVVARRHAAEPEAVAAVEARQIEIGGKPRHLTEPHINPTHIANSSAGFCFANNKNQIVEAVAVDIACRR